MFLSNKYSRWYWSIINRAKLFPQTRKARAVYVEQHHIIPTCLGGQNTADNLVFLTAREHLVCHALLTKMVKSKSAQHKMFHALSSMSKPLNKKQTANRAFKASYSLCLARSKQGATSGSFSKEKHPFAIRITIGGVEFSSIHAASSALGISYYSAAKRAESKIRTGDYPKPKVSRASAGTFAVGRHPAAKPVIIDGIEYSSSIQASKAIGLPPYVIREIAKAGINTTQYMMLLAKSRKPFRYLKHHGLLE